ncbi:sugar ABC transporter ATP-binding protein [Amycolatopsis viridis]|uniref:Ribose transport system ATP-binding protein n=1 Tax=Amycolatopsis viridis TaxID=185678 RepID=A0ABX0SNJ1_9PSEU|nr:sugar ABC transporter ATP-binding protein [Amycolatopsis viridis]NIH78473.1 ribose transport system ATP-binding protein [Amycolatopsis viridis]
MTSGAPVLSLRHVSRRFNGVPALDDVSLDVLPGEVHGLIGENGSGKSTLIKVLAGYYTPEPAAEVRINGEISFVHQNLALIGDLTVAENLWMHAFTRAPLTALTSGRRMRERARTTLLRYGVDLDPAATVGSLNPTDRARLAIVRAGEQIRRLDDAPGLLVLDEPTVFLPREGVEALFQLVSEVVGRGASVLFVSHDLDEVCSLTDRVTVLRDGRKQATVSTRDTGKPRLIELITGHTLDAAPRRETTAAGDVAVRVEGLCSGRLRDVHVSLRRGEIVGFTGLIGSGAEELPYALFGATGRTSGKIVLNGRGQALERLTPAEAVRRGIGLIPADRAGQGSAGSLSVLDNLLLLALDRCRKRGVLHPRTMRDKARRLIDAFDVRPRDPLVPYQTLSGGNQQKVLLAKWFDADPALLLLDEPTQGVDIGAREEIFRLLRRQARAGTCVVLATTDYEQLELVADRVLIVSGGRVVAELTGDEITKTRIAHEVYVSGEGGSPTAGQPRQGGQL